MKLQITRYKQTGKFYDTIEIESPGSTYFDNTSLKLVQSRCNNWDGYATVCEIQEDGFILPIRLLTNKELSYE